MFSFTHSLVTRHFGMPGTKSKITEGSKTEIISQERLLEKAKDGSKSEAVFYPMYFSRPSAIQLKL